MNNKKKKINLNEPCQCQSDLIKKGMKEKEP